MREERSLSRTEAACMAGVGRGPNGIDELRVLSSANGTNSAERWYTVEQFEREHVIETLEKLEQGDLDDEIWGKIILMEKCRRLAKAYLRRTTVIIDGSSDEYDGITLGFNRFENADCDEASDEIRRKIGDGVIVKVDENGNIKAMARGLAPVIVQGWQEPKSKCIPEQLIAQKGHLITLKDRLKGITDQQRVEKIFDMRLFNLAIEQELARPEPNAPELLLKTCVRVALVKDVGTNALKTPCWFMIVNLVALDVLRTKLPFLLNNCSVPGTLRMPSRNASTIFSAPSTAQSITTLNEVCPSQYIKQFGTSGRLSESLPVLHQIQQLIHLANTLEKTSSPEQNSISARRRRSLSGSDSEDLPATVQKTIHSKKQCTQPRNLTLSSESSSGVSSMDLMKNFEKVEKWRKNSSKFLEEHEEEKDLDDEEMIDVVSPEREPKKPVEIPVPMPHAHRKPLTSDLFVNSNSKDVQDNGKIQNIHCIRISDNEECLEEESSRNRLKNTENDQLATDHYVTSGTQDVSPYGITEIIQYPRQMQAPERTHGAKKSNTSIKDPLHPTVSSEKAGEFSHQRQYSGQVPVVATKNREPVADERYVDCHSMYLDEGFGEIQKNSQHSGHFLATVTKNPESLTNKRYVDSYPVNPDKEPGRTRKKNYKDVGSSDAINYSGRQNAGIPTTPLSGNQRSRSQNYLLTELPPVDYPAEDEDGWNGRRFGRENVKKKTLNLPSENGPYHYPEKVSSLQEKCSGVPQYPYVTEAEQHGKKNRFKNVFHLPGKSAKNANGEISSQNRPMDMQQNSRYPGVSGPTVEAGFGSPQPRFVRPETVIYPVPIVRQKHSQSQQPYVMVSPTSKKSTDAESRHTPDIFINPVYSALGPTTSEAVNRCRQPAMMSLPRWEAPAMYDALWDRRRNPRIGIPYGSMTLMPPYPPYMDSTRHSAKAFRRFV